MSIIASDKSPSESTDPVIERFNMESHCEGKLSGKTFAAKDLIDIAGKRTGCGNPQWRESHPPAAANAVCVDLLLSEGATLAGKTVTDELAFDLIGENHFYGTPLNPRSPDRVPGGSSSGSAAAVAAGLVDFAIGTDTGGSVRVPASNCGLFGYRPSHDAISVAGVNPLAPSFDTVGVIAGRMDVLADAATVLLGRTIDGNVKAKRLLVLTEAFDAANPDVCAVLLGELQRVETILGLQREPISIHAIDEERQQSGLDIWIETYRMIQGAEIWSCLGPWIEANSVTFGPRIAKNFEYARNADRAKLADAIARRARFIDKCDALLTDADVICIPSVPAPAPFKGSIGTDRYANNYVITALSLCSIAGLCRLPQVTLPVAQVDGSPIGLSLLAKHGSDLTLLNTALATTGGARQSCNSTSL
jgi:amidase